MNDLNSLLQSIGVIAEITAIFYNALLETGLSEDVAVTLTSKMIGEFMQVIGKNGKENNNDNETE